MASNARYITFFLSALLVAQYLLKVSNATIIKEILSRDSSFSIISRVTGSGNHSIGGVFKELYSSTQSRSFTHYTLTKDDKNYKGQIYLDGFKGIVLEYTEGKCGLKESADFLSQMFDVGPWRLKSEDETILTGPVARIISFIDENDKSKSYTPVGVGIFEREYSPENDAMKTKYKLLYQAKSEKDIERQPIPTEIRIFKFEQLSIEFIISKPLPIESLEKSVMLDPFTIKPSSGLIPCLDKKRYKVTLRPNSDTSRPKLSFKFKGKKIHKESSDHMIESDITGFVAYDYLLKSLRVDKEWLSTGRIEREVINIDDSLHISRIYFQMWERNLHLSESGSKNLMDASDLGGMQTSMIATEFPFTKNPLESIELILTGSKDLLDLGSAKVEGIDCRLYASQSSRLPLWLEQPQNFENDYQRFEVEVYTKTNINSNQPTNGLILRMNVHSDREIYVLEIFDFLWFLDYENKAEAFSLTANFRNPIRLSPWNTDDISSENLKVDLEIDILNAQSLKANDPLMIYAGERDRTILGTLQNRLKCPVTMIDSIDSRSVVLKGGGHKILMASLSIAHRVGLYLMSRIRITTAGSSEKLDRDPSLVENIKTESLDICTAMAIYRSTGNVTGFSYDRSDGTCLLFSDKLRKLMRDYSAQYVGFQEDPRGTIEIFSVQKKLHESVSNCNSIANITNFEKMILQEGNVRDPPLSFRIVRSKIQKIASVAPDNSQIHFNGFGILPDNDYSRIIRSRDLNHFFWDHDDYSPTRLEPPMTREQCHNACLESFDCNSYSVCLGPDGFECINSKADFSPISMGELLKQHITDCEREIKVQVLDEDLGNKTVTLKRHLNCEIHMKQYLDLFETKSLNRREIKLGKIIPKSIGSSERDRDECAKLCFLDNITYLRQYMKRFEHFSITNHSMERPNEKVCNVITYLIKSNGEQFCILEDLDESMKPSESSEADEVFIVDGSYSFKFEHFFENYHDIKIKRSNTSPKIMEAHMNISRTDTRNHVDEGASKLLKEFMDGGGYFSAYRPSSSVASCAKECFSQVSTPWPGCLSFGIKESNNQELCIKNTISLHQVFKRGSSKSDLIYHSSANRKERYNHYELRRELSLSDSIKFVEQPEKAEPESIGVLWILGTVCLACACGIAISSMMSSYFFSRPIRRGSEAHLDDELDMEIIN